MFDVRLARLGGMRASDYFELTATFPFREDFPGEVFPWTWIASIRRILDRVLPKAGPDLQGKVPPGLEVSGDVYIHASVSLPSHGVIRGPAWIGPDCELRPGVYIRGNVIVEGQAVLGNACEFKNCLILEGAQIPHFNYVGDSVVGKKAHLGAGAILSNLRFDQQPIVVRGSGGRWETGLRKFGAMVGDGAEVGCNVVLQPGTLLGRRALIAPGCAVGGIVPEETLTYARPETKTVRRPR